MRKTARVVALVAGLAAATAVVSGQVRATPVMADDPTQVRTIPAGVQFDVLLKTPVHSGKVKVDERFDATLLEKYELQGQVLLAAGATVRGFISSVRPSSKAVHQGQVTLSFDGLQASGATVRLRASVVGVFDPKQADQLSRLGTGPAVGARSGNGTTALSTVLVSEGGTIVSSQGQDVNLPVGTVLRIRLDLPLEVPVTR